MGVNCPHGPGAPARRHHVHGHRGLHGPDGGPSALNAVMCALAVQEALEDEEMRLHIGIHLGDIVLEDSEVSGDGVNIASRLCSLSDGNSVLVSGELYSSFRNQPGIEAKSIGERELHNVGRPVQVYRVSGQGSEPRAPAADSQDILGRPAVAVLPFDNLSGDPDQDYFADGIAEDLITRLSIFRAFPVIARNSSFVYKGQSVPVQQVARDLSVRYVVEGSVRKVGQRVRVSVQLIDATTEQHVWARVRPRVVRPGSRSSARCSSVTECRPRAVHAQPPAQSPASSARTTRRSSLPVSL